MSHDEGLCVISLMSHDEGLCVLGLVALKGLASLVEGLGVSVRALHLWVKRLVSLGTGLGVSR